MKRGSLVILTFIAPLLLATVARSSPLDSLAKSPRGRMSLSGPRFGVSLVKGDNADRLKERFDVKPIVTQFGWQFETRFLSTTDGFAGLSEWIPLVAGVEQGVFLPSLSWLIGFRSPKGNELGFGPNISLGGVGSGRGYHCKDRDIELSIQCRGGVVQTKRYHIPLGGIQRSRVEANFRE